jgi:hypothetical protein
VSVFPYSKSHILGFLGHTRLYTCQTDTVPKVFCPQLLLWTLFECELRLHACPNSGPPRERERERSPLVFTLRFPRSTGSGPQFHTAFHQLLRDREHSLRDARTSLVALRRGANDAQQWGVRWEAAREVFSVALQVFERQPGSGGAVLLVVRVRRVHTGKGRKIQIGIENVLAPGKFFAVDVDALPAVAHTHTPAKRPWEPHVPGWSAFIHRLMSFADLGALKAFVLELHAHQ